MADTSESSRRIPWRDRLRIPFRRKAGSPGADSFAADSALASPARGRIARHLLWLVPVLLVASYPLGMLLIHEVNDDLTFGTTDLVVPINGSRAVAMSAALIRREVIDGPWAANDPFFMPGSMLDNMPAFQQGIVQALARFSFELSDQIGRVRGSSRTDPDLQEAAGLLQYSGTKWVVRPIDLARADGDVRGPVHPGAPRPDRLQPAPVSGTSRVRPPGGQPPGDPRPHRPRHRLLLGHPRSGCCEPKRLVRYPCRRHLLWRQGPDVRLLPDPARVAEGLRAGVIAERDILGAYAQLLDSMARAAGLGPWVVVNGDPDAQFQPSHLASEGFYMRRARTQLREITSILQK